MTGMKILCQVCGHPFEKCECMSTKLYHIKRNLKEGERQREKEKKS